MSWDIFSKSKIQYFLQKLKDKFVQKETGKGLSTNDYTTTDKNKVSKINTTTTSLSGNPISISGLKANQLAVNPIITLEPIQAGSGTPSPSNIRPISGYDKIEVLSCSVNLNDESTKTKQIITDTGEIQNNASENLYDYICISESKNYVISAKNTDSSAKRIRISYFDANKTFIVRKFTDISANTTGSYDVKSDTVLFGIPSGCKYIRINHADGISEIMFYEGLGVSAYVPYHKTTDLSEALGQTLYRFTEDVRSGKITTQYVYTTFSGASDETIERVGTNISGKWRFVLTKTGLVTIPWSDGTHKSNMLTTNILDEVTNTDTNACTVGIHYRANGGGNSFIAYFGDSYTTVDDVKALLQTTPLQVVYAVPTITTIQLTPHEIALSQGYNYISTNGTSLSLAYHNGELATHADVEQLAETVNELGDIINSKAFKDIISQAFTTTSANSWQATGITFTAKQGKLYGAYGLYQNVRIIGIGIGSPNQAVPIWKIETDGSFGLPNAIIMASVYADTTLELYVKTAAAGLNPYKIVEYK